MGKPKTVEYSSSDQSSDSDFLDEDLASGKSDTKDLGLDSHPRKRGRGPSKRPCLNRNALMARVNRQKKKEYLEKIENKLSIYKKDNKSLSTIIQQQGIDLKRLRAEVSYLRSILNNNTHITALLKTMNETLKQKKPNEKSTEFSVENNWKYHKSASSKSDSENSPNSPTTPGKKMASFVDTDHNYSGVSNDLFNFEGINCDPYFGTFGDNFDKVSQIGIDDIQQMRFDPEVFELATTQSEEVEHFGGNCGDLNLNLFDNLDNSGICLHVNSGKISIEYCAICHLNSVNSDDP